MTESNMTAREYAASLGLAKLARGRMSPAALEAIAKAEKDGTVFKKSPSQIYKEELEARKASGEVIKRGRKPSGITKSAVAEPKGPRKKKVLTREHIAAMQAGRKKAKAEGSGEILPVEPHEKGRRYSEEWYQKVFAVNFYVVNPTGVVFKVVKQKTDTDPFTHFVDTNGKAWKAKVNASWGVRKGFPVRKDYTPNNDK